MPELLPAVAGLALVDHHCHGVVPADLTPDEFEGLLTEAERPHPGASLFDSQIGLAVRRWCAPLLDLPRHAPAGEYLTRRAELGHVEVTRRMLRAAGLGALCVDTGFTPRPLLSPAELAEAAGAPGYEVVRLESVAEQVAAAGDMGVGFADAGGPAAGFAGGGGPAVGFAGGGGPGAGFAGAGVTAAGFADAVRANLAERSRTAVAAKSIAAYRVGLDLAPRRPTAPEVAAAAGRWLGTLRPGGAVRLADEVLHRFLIYSAIDLGLPVQIHAGLGDRDVRLHRCNPLLLTDLLRATEPSGVPVLLLHNYPYHRQAGYLAQVFSHVYADVSLATHNVGHRAGALIQEALELTPFGKMLYASDAFGLPELYYLGAVLFRRALSDLLSAGLADDAWTERDAARIATMIGAANARRVYRLP